MSFAAKAPIVCGIRSLALEVYAAYSHVHAISKRQTVYVSRSGCSWLVSIHFDCPGIRSRTESVDAVGPFMSVVATSRPGTKSTIRACTSGGSTCLEYTLLLVEAAELSDRPGGLSTNSSLMMI